MPIYANMDQTIVGNTRRYVELITPTSYADRPFIPYRLHEVVDDVSYWRSFVVLVGESEPGHYHNPPMENQYIMELAIVVKYPLSGHDIHEVVGIAQEDMKAIDLQLSHTNMDTDNTQMYGRWMSGSSVEADDEEVTLTVTFQVTHE